MLVVCHIARRKAARTINPNHREGKVIQFQHSNQRLDSHVNGRILSRVELENFDVPLNPVASESGTKTEYTTDPAMPTNHVYLEFKMSRDHFILLMPHLHS
jgi:hypothetical protein